MFAHLSFGGIFTLRAALVVDSGLATEVRSEVEALAGALAVADHSIGCHFRRPHLDHDALYGHGIIFDGVAYDHVFDRPANVHAFAPPVAVTIARGGHDTHTPSPQRPAPPLRVLGDQGQTTTTVQGPTNDSKTPEYAR